MCVTQKCLSYNIHNPPSSLSHPRISFSLDPHIVSYRPPPALSRNQQPSPSSPHPPRSLAVTRLRKLLGIGGSGPKRVPLGRNSVNFPILGIPSSRPRPWSLINSRHVTTLVELSLAAYPCSTPYAI